ncbi:MAG: dihydrodipicolinate synthase family protein [Chloroflexi bacterium]|nr:dihydrodipicolinate synthase family protein [Chloroflexota bacterium]
MGFRGVFTIPVTPFDEQGAIDFPSLESCVQFCVDAGAHGLVMPVNASEFFTLSDAERLRVIETGVKVNAGAIPFVAGISGVSPQHALELSLRAQDAGADEQIALPPT